MFIGRNNYSMLIIKPEGIRYQNIIKEYLEKHNFSLAIDSVPMRLTLEQASQIYASKKVEDSTWDPKPYWIHVTSGLSVVMFLKYKCEIDDAQDVLKVLVGNKNPEKARTTSLRFMLKEMIRRDYGALYTDDYYLNGVHAAANVSEADYESRILFGKRMEDYISSHPSFKG